MLELVGVPDSDLILDFYLESRQVIAVLGGKTTRMPGGLGVRT
jgi:hypothetical protein